MASQGMKRTAAAASDPAKQSKKRRAQVMQALGQEGEALSAACGGMLAATIPGLLAVAPAERDAYQKEVVEIIEKALGGQQAALKAEMDAARAKAAAVDAEKAAREAEIAFVEEALAAAKAAVPKARAKLAEDTAAVDVAEAEISTAKEKQAGHDAEVAETKASKSRFEAVMAGAFATMRDNPPPSKRDQNKIVAIINKQIEPLNLEEAFMVGIPLALGKPTESRGDFDRQVIEFLSNFFDAEVSKCEERIAGSAQEAADRAAVVAAKVAAFDAAKAVADASTVALSKADGEKTALVGQLGAAKKQAKVPAAEAEKCSIETARTEAAFAEHQEALAAFAVERDGAPGAAAGAGA